MLWLILGTSTVVCGESRLKLSGVRDLPHKGKTTGTSVRPEDPLVKRLNTFEFQRANPVGLDSSLFRFYVLYFSKGSPIQLKGTEKSINVGVIKVKCS